MTEQKPVKKSKKPASKYAIKKRRRARAAKQAGLPPGTPWPIIWAKQEETKDAKQTK
jgi:hypothetical protein